MFCGTCGTKNPDINRFCRQCGAKLPGRAPRALPEEEFADLQGPSEPSQSVHAKVAVLMDVAFAYHREGKVDQAIQTCLEAIGLNSESTSAHSLLAVLYEEKGQFDEAVTHLRRVLELNPDSEADRENLARLLGEKPLSRPVPMAPAGRMAPPRIAILAGVAAAVVVLAAALVPVVRVLRTPDDGASAAYQPPANVVDHAPTTAVPVQPAPESPTSGPSPSLAENPGIARAATPEPFESTTPNPVLPPRPLAPINTAPGARDEESLQPLPPLQPSRPPRAQALSPSELEVIRPSAPTPTPRRTPVVAANPLPRAGGPATVPMPPAPPAPAQPPSLDATFTPAPDGAASPRRTQPPAAARPQPDPVRPRVNVRVSDPTARDYEQWARQASASGSYDQAATHYEKALAGARAGSERGRIHQQLAYAYQQMGKTSEAGAEYRKAIEDYRQQVSQGSNVDLAQAGIRASEAGLRSLGL